MSNKEKLQEIKESWVSEGHLVKIDREHFEWLIEEAKKASQLQEQKDFWLRSYETLEYQFQKAKERIKYLKNELRNCGYSDTDLDNDFLWKFQDKQG